jgi:hypothetical protein
VLQFKSTESLAAIPDFWCKPQLPFYVQPEADEALLSWILRLAARLNVSVHALALRSFGVDDRAGHTQWWCRPDPWLLNRMSDRSGVPVEHLRRMTFQKWAPRYREDDANERFGGRRFEGRSPQHRALRFALCAQRLAQDTNHYLRPSWLIGWMAVCPKHETKLTVRCPQCLAKLSLPSFASAAPFAPRNCTRCGSDIGTGMKSYAHPAVIRIQSALLRSKRDGLTNFESMGALNWATTVTLADVLVGMFWTGTTLAERQRIYDQYERENQETDSEESSPYHGRYGALKFLAWLTDGWPESPGARVGMALLSGWLNGKHNRISGHLRAKPADSSNPRTRWSEARIRERLGELLASANPHEQPSVALQPRYSIHD